MNKISTGAFQAEMDSYTEKNDMVAKLVGAWEKKNAKVARAGGVSLMALTLAACGSDDEVAVAVVATDTTTTAVDTTTTTTPVVVGATFDMTPLTDVASSTTAVSGSISSTFRFTTADDTVNAISASVQAADTLLDSSGTDNDVMNITSTAAMNAMTAVNIETVNVTMASGAASVTLTNFTGTNTVNVSGTVASTVTNAGTADINSNSYTRVLTVDNTTGYGGTAALGTADALNMTMTGASYGSTAATRSGLTLTAANNATNETLETLNITSSGDTANAFVLDTSDVDVLLSTVNMLGTQDITMRVLTAEVSGVAIVGTSNTGSTTIRVDNNGGATLNAGLFAGVDNLLMVDGTTPALGGDAMSVSGLKSGQKITIADDADATTLSFSGVAGATDTTTVVIDNETATADLDITSIDIQNVETLNLESLGNANTTAAVGSAATVNIIDSLTGDMTAVTVTGDTPIEIDLASDAPTTGSRTVAVDASAMTSFLVVNEVAANTKVSYNITGTGFADTLTLNATGGTITAGAGADTITTAAGNDTVDAGAGADTINVVTGTDTFTGGAGVDTYDFANTGTDAVVQVSTYDDINNTGTVTLATGDTIDLNVNGYVWSQPYATSEVATLAAHVTAHAAAVLASTGVTLTTGDTNKDFILTGATDGTAFTTAAYLNDAGVMKIDVAAATATAVKLVTQSTTITDFAAGDILDLADVLTEAGKVYYEGAAASSAATDNVYVLTDTAGFANAEAAEDAVVAGTVSTDNGDGIFIFLNSSLGYAQVVKDGDISADSGDLGGNSGAHVIANLTNITSAELLAAAFTTDSIVI
jgi:hypothetical protein